MKFKHGNYTIEVEDCDNVSKKEIKKAVVEMIKTLKDDDFCAYEALWYSEDDSEGNPHTKEFKTRKEVIDFYNMHKNDPDKFDWWVTKRDRDWYVIEDIII